MIYTTLGKTGLEISRLGFGGIPIQQMDKQSAAELIAEAVDSGINFFDSARGYTVSEELMGEGLKGKRAGVYLATKSMARDKAGMIKDIEASLNNFKTDYIDLYQFHNIASVQDFEKVMAPGGAMEAISEYKTKGFIGHIGITSHSLDIIEKSLGYDIFETVQYPYNAVERQAEEVFARAHEKNLGVIAMKPFAGGAITNNKAALKFILQNRDVTCAIPGMCSIEQLKENIKAAEAANMTDAEVEALSKEASELGERFCRRCGYCQPCPQGINIPMSFLLEGYYNRYNLKEWAIERYTSLPVKVGQCSKCGLCETKCPYKLPIMEMLEAVKNIFD